MHSEQKFDKDYRILYMSKRENHEKKSRIDQ